MSLATDHNPSSRARLCDEPARLCEGQRCTACGFQLWTHLATLEVSEVGLYDDSRFPGRLMVSLREHYEHLDEVPEDVSTAFMRDVRLCSLVLRRDLGAHRVNLAVLGNQEAHVHAHLIPRRSSDEPMPHNAPWQDPRPRTQMSVPQRDEVIGRLIAALTAD